MNMLHNSEPMADYTFLKELGCGPVLANVTVSVHESAIAQFPPLWILREPRRIEDMTLLRAAWPRSVKLDGKGSDYWSPLRDLYMAYWPYPPDQLEWLNECVVKLPQEDVLRHFLYTE
ncbi:hypothetical protein RvY_00529 [Ramazzottius varieornatus]|uniref:Uncharacterized protein n=1 Tax=Ramazzottius varieornatus TaxID=947166 RepID=A0A1D1UD38_RAMVA|nr:hypothetical protein RvY_00529 [Ramazzottius varieornatus]